MHAAKTQNLKMCEGKVVSLSITDFESDFAADVVVAVAEVSVSRWSVGMFEYQYFQEPQP